MNCDLRGSLRDDVFNEQVTLFTEKGIRGSVLRRDEGRGERASALAQEGQREEEGRNRTWLGFGPGLEKALESLGCKPRVLF